MKTLWWVGCGAKKESSYSDTIQTIEGNQFQRSLTSGMNIAPNIFGHSLRSVSRHLTEKICAEKLRTSHFGMITSLRFLVPLRKCQSQIHTSSSSLVGDQKAIVRCSCVSQRGDLNPTGEDIFAQRRAGRPTQGRIARLGSTAKTTVARGDRNAPDHVAPRPRIMSAAFSAIMMTGEAVFPETILGMTDASTIRNPFSPCTRRSAPTTAPGS